MSVVNFNVLSVKKRNLAIKLNVALSLVVKII